MTTRDDKIKMLFTAISITMLMTLLVSNLILSNKLDIMIKLLQEIALK